MIGFEGTLKLKKKVLSRHDCPVENKVLVILRSDYQKSVFKFGVVGLTKGNFELYFHSVHGNGMVSKTTDFASQYLFLSFF
jgi:hypothetical protein